MSVYTGSTLIEAPPERVFEYVRMPEHQPECAVDFVRSTRPLGDGRYLMETPVGEMTYRVEADPARGTVDFVFETPHGDSVLPTRVVPHPAGSIFTFTILRQPRDAGRGVEGRQARPRRRARRAQEAARVVAVPARSEDPGPTEVPSARIASSGNELS